MTKYLSNVIIGTFVCFYCLYLPISLTDIPESVSLFLSIIASGFFNRTLALLFQDRRIVSGAIYLMIVEWAVSSNDAHTQLVIFQFILFIPALNIFGVIAESINRDIILDPVETNLKIEKFYNTGYKYFLTRFTYETWVNVIVSICIIAILITVPNFLFSLYKIKSIIFPISFILFCFIWIYTIKQAKNKLSSIITAIIASIILSFSFHLFSNFNQSLPVLFGLTILLENNKNLPKTIIKSSYENGLDIHFKTMDESNSLSIGVISGFISSIAIGVPNSVLFKVLSKGESRSEQSEIQDFWVSSSLNSVMGFYLYLFGGMARSGIFDNLSKLDVQINNSMIVISIVIFIFIQVISQYYSECIYKEFLEIIEGRDLSFNFNLVNIIKSFILITAITQTNLSYYLNDYLTDKSRGLVLLIWLSIIVVVVIALQIYTRATKNLSNRSCLLFPISALPFKEVITNFSI